MEDVIESHPLRLLEERHALPKGELNLMLARSGVGKSAALINFALDQIMEGNRVLHFTAGMPSEKTHHYYQKIFSDYSAQNPGSDLTWESIYHQFMVISYLDADKMIADITAEVRTILDNADIEPSLIVVDGLDCSADMTDTLNKLQTVADTHQVKLLASMRIHRKQDGDIDLDTPFNAVKDHASKVFFLEPEPDQDRVLLELITDQGRELMPVYLCPHDFIFRAK